MAKQASDEFRTLVADATAHFQAGRLTEAESAYRAALAIIPADPMVTHNLGVTVAAQGRHQAAIDCFDEALKRDQNFVSAHYNRAVALLKLGETAEAIKAFSRAAALEPEHYEAHRALGFLWLGQGDRGRALDHLARTYELRRGDDRTAIALKSLDDGNAPQARTRCRAVSPSVAANARPSALRVPGAQLLCDCGTMSKA